MRRGFRREILISILVIVVSMGAFGIYTWKLHGNIRGSAAGVASLNQKIVDQAQLSQVIVELRRVEAEADRYQARMDAIVPEEEQLLDFRTWMRNQATVYSVSASVEFKDRGKFREGANIMFQNSAVGFDGALDSIVSLLKELEMGADRFLLGFDAFEATRNASNYRFGATAKIFFQGKSTTP